MEKQYIAKRKKTGFISRKISSLITEGSIKSKSDWIREIGPENFELGIISGCLTESKSGEYNIGGAIKPGEYIIYKSKEGYIMYHVGPTENGEMQLWKTVSENIKGLSDPNNTEPVDTIANDDTSKTVQKQGIDHSLLEVEKSHYVDAGDPADPKNTGIQKFMEHSDYESRRKWINSKEGRSKRRGQEKRRRHERGDKKDSHGNTFREKRAAHERVRYNVDNGKIKKPEKCEVCNKRKAEEADHGNDYSKKNDKNIVWKCRKCHQKTKVSKIKKGMSEA